MADDMNNDELEQGAASEGMPEDLKRLLARANEDDASAYDPDAESDEDEDDGCLLYTSPSPRDA